MKNHHNHRGQYHSSIGDSAEHQEDADWYDPEDMIHAKKKHQSHRDRHQNQKRRNLNEQSH